MPVRGGRTSRFLGILLIALAWLLPLLLLFAVFLEYFGGIGLYQRIRYGNDSIGSETDLIHGGELYGFLNEQYQSFTVQRLHPLSLFSFPSSVEEREAISNETVSIGAHGFRGVGPDEAGERELAFLIGGSTAFGHFASADSTTVTGFLNSKQDKYHFVNAGVPSWNSTQELRRMIDELLAYEPALIITLNGSNDVAVALDYARKGKGYPLGSPESFDKLEALVDDVRGGCREPDIPFYEYAFPDLTRHTRNMLGFTEGPDRKELTEGELDTLAAEVAQKYLWNIGMMSQISDSFGVEFIALTQPVADLHQNVEHVPDSSSERTRIYAGFREAVVSESNEFPLHGFSSIFDSHFEDVPVFSFGLEELDQQKHIFIDHVHFTDRGNEIIADEIISLIKL